MVRGVPGSRVYPGCDPGMSHFFVSIAYWDTGGSAKLIYEVPEKLHKEIDKMLRENPEAVELQSLF
jgi:hypothetical protein